MFLLFIFTIIPMLITFSGCVKKGERVISTGVRYTVIQEGSGAAPKRGDSVTVNYTGWLEDGKKFDSSVDRHQPFTFRLGVGEVIRGWDDGIATMKAGGITKFTIPPELAYGNRGVPGVIPPDATLIFEVELLAVKSGK
ncbi:MAG: FKBP-type peptidyl-prolyl cis-trans isomerase [Bacteroidota bacterium]|nr:FKBP-type peptidyl-prolyl cis-trans isomerase [Bacteroidota bacterium]